MKEGTPVIPLTFDEALEDAWRVCKALSESDEALKREMLAHAGNRWSLGVIYQLGIAGSLRHAEIARRLPGVTQRMLTRTLRQLERDGFITRKDYREVPPRVDYDLTELGRGWLIAMTPLATWAMKKAGDVSSARAGYDERHALTTSGR